MKVDHFHIKLSAILLILFVVFIGFNPEDIIPHNDSWEEIYQQYLSNLPSPEDDLDTNLHNHLEVYRTYGQQLARYVSDLKKASSSTDPEVLLDLAEAMNLAGPRLETQDRAVILGNLYERLAPDITPELAESIFKTLFVNEYQGDIEKIVDALEGNYPESCLFSALMIFVKQDRPHPKTCEYLYSLMKFPDEVIAAGARKYFKERDCSGAFGLVEESTSEAHEEKVE